MTRSRDSYGAALAAALAAALILLAAACTVKVSPAPPEAREPGPGGGVEAPPEEAAAPVERTFPARVLGTRMIALSGSVLVVLEVEVEAEDDELAEKPFIDIFVGLTEGDAIWRALEGQATPRPMTHDLFASALEELGAKIERLTVTELRDGLRTSTYIGELTVRTAGGEVMTLDCRPSDGMAMALGAGAPIHVAEGVLRRAGRPESPDAPGPRTSPAPGIGDEEGREF